MTNLVLVFGEEKFKNLKKIEQSINGKHIPVCLLVARHLSMNGQPPMEVQIPVFKSQHL